MFAKRGCFPQYRFSSTTARWSSRSHSTYSVQQLKNDLGYFPVAKSPFALIDVRDTHLFMGWKKSPEHRSGHIAGADNLPLLWWEQKCVPKIESDVWKKALIDRGVEADSEVILYGSTTEEAEAVKKILLDTAPTGKPKKVHVLGGGFPAWDGKVNSLPGYSRLVYPEWLHTLINNGTPPEYKPTKSGWKLFHVNYGKPEDYTETHLPGAFHMDTNQLEWHVTWNRRTPQELENALRHYGIDRDTVVVLYGRTTRASEEAVLKGKPGQNAGQIAAYRAAMILTYCGVKDVRVLDGGYDAWISRNYPVTTVEYKPKPVASTRLSIPEQPAIIVDLEEAQQLLQSPNTGALLSIRSFEEFIGLKSGYNYIAPRGDIAGALFGDCGSDAYHMQTYRNPDNRTMLSFPRIEAIFRKMGATRDKRVAHYCGTGWRASESWMYARCLGHEKVAVYDGGWFEWSKHPHLPVSKEHPELTRRQKEELWGTPAPKDTVAGELLAASERKH